MVLKYPFPIKAHSVDKEKQFGNENLILPTSIWTHNIKRLFKSHNCPNICIKRVGRYILLSCERISYCYIA